MFNWLHLLIAFDAGVIAVRLIDTFVWFLR